MNSLYRELAYTLTVTGVLGGMLAIDGFVLDHDPFQGWLDVALAGACLLVAAVLVFVEAWKQAR